MKLKDGMMMAAAKRRYGAEQTFSVQPNETVGIDTFMEDDAPNSVFYANTLYLGDDNAGGNRRYIPLIKFDLSMCGIPPTALITSAVLDLHNYTSFKAGVLAPVNWAVNLHRMLKNWVEAEACWNRYATGSDWETGGGLGNGTDRVEEVTATKTLNETATNAFVPFESEKLKDDIKKFITGDYQNYGWMLEAPALVNLGTSRAYNIFASSSNATETIRPKLTIKYRRSSKQYATLPKNLLNTPAIMIEFDDGYADTLTQALSYMETKQLKGTVYVVSSLVGSGELYMTEANLSTIYAAGWDIGNHTTTHANMSALEQEEVETRMTGCKEYLDALGFTRASSHVAYPYGGTSDAVRAALAASGMLSGRTIVEQKLTMAEMTWNDLPAYQILNTDSVATVTDYIDTVVSTGKVGTLLFHRITAAGTGGPVEYSIANFRLVMDYLVRNRVNVITKSQLWSLRSNYISYKLPWT